MEKRNISDLPPEASYFNKLDLNKKLIKKTFELQILIKIFEQLESPEIFKVSEVCKNWLNIAQHPTIVSKTIVRLHSLENNRFLKSWRKFNFKLSIDTHLPDKYFEFKKKFFENIIEIEFDRIYLPSLDILRQYLENLTNLKSLSFIDCRFQNLTTSPDVLISLNVTSLLFKGSFLKAIVVDYILSITPNLKILTANLFEADYIKTIVRYGKNPELTKSLRELSIYNGTRTDFCDLFQSKHLNLHKFVWNSQLCRRPNENLQSLDIFLTNQSNLKELNLNVNPSATQLLITPVIWTLNTLEHLTFDYRSEYMESLNFKPFWKLKYLKIVYANSNIFKSLTTSSQMESLTLESFCEDINETEITDKFEFLTNLKVFNLYLGHISLSESFYIGNEMLQTIFRHLINLRELDLEDSTTVKVSVFFLFVINYKLIKITKNSKHIFSSEKVK